MTAIVNVDAMVKSITEEKYGIDGVVNRLTDGVSVERIHTMRVSNLDGVGGVVPTVFKENSMWQWGGSPYSGASWAASPTTWFNPGRLTVGALGQLDGTTKRLLSLNVFAGSRGCITLYDRLAHMGGLDGTSVAVQNVNGGADGKWPRYSGDHVGNQIWVEIYLQVGTTARTITCSYKNENGTTHTTTPVVFGGTGDRELMRVFRLPLAADDKGVSAVISVTIGGGSTGTVGAFGVTVARPLAIVPMSTAGGGSVGMLDGVMPVIKDDACLAFTWMPSVGVSDICVGIECCIIADSLAPLAWLSTYPAFLPRPRRLLTAQQRAFFKKADP